jgi:hypothetical protein
MALIYCRDGNGGRIFLEPEAAKQEKIEASIGV